MFYSEKNMQDWLSKKLQNEEGLRKLIIPFHFQGDDSHANKKIVESYNYCLKTLNMIRVVCENKDISQFNSEILKPDFLLYSIETESWVIVELKNIAGPTRQVATELSAYANAMKSYFPWISDGDIISVIVSNDWPTLLKNHVFNEVYWLNRRVICFKPVFVGDEIKLECINPSEFTNNHSRKLLTPESFSGHQLCLYGNSACSGGKVDDLELHIEQIRSAFYRMVNKSSSLHSHGFAFLWRDFRQYSVAAYSITIVDINPYENNLYDTCEEKGIANILQEVLYEYEASGNTFSSFEIMNDGDFYLKSICNPWPEGYSNWGVLREYMLEHSDLIEFRCWGVVAEIYEHELEAEYRKGRFSTKYECPSFGLKFVEEKLFNA
ncbi:hypothetical protein ACE1OG_11830 [Aeromonas hydrophila]